MDWTKNKLWSSLGKRDLVAKFANMSTKKIALVIGPVGFYTRSGLNPRAWTAISSTLRGSLAPFRRTSNSN